MELADALDQTFEHAHNVIAGVRPDQLGGTTPCDEWSVRDLLTHTIGVVAGMGASVRGEARCPRPDGVQLGDDPAAQFRAAADCTIAGWRQPGVIDPVVDGPPGRM